jgi:hypothetical protein
LMHWLQVDETHFANLWIVVMITNLTTLLPLPLIGWLPGAETEDDQASAPEGLAMAASESDMVVEKELVTEL